MRYIVIDERLDGTGDMFTTEIADRDAAIDEGRRQSDHLTASEHAARVVYVLESVNPDESSQDHFDGDVIWVDGMG